MLEKAYLRPQSMGFAGFDSPKWGVATTNPPNAHPCVEARHHGLRGSASPVLTATGFVNGRWQFSTPHTINTRRPITKKFGTGVYVGGPYGCAKFGANPSMGASGQMGEI